MTLKYGRYWPDGVDAFNIELACFLLGLSEEDGGLGKFQHCRNIIDHLWNQEGSAMRFDWHPWAERMIEEACNNDFLSVAGCASSGKSDTYAVWAIINFLTNPKNTRVFVTSTSLKDSRMRIWGRIREYWRVIPNAPGRLVDSAGMIKYVDPITGDATEDSGITLLAAEQKKEKTAIGKMIGFKRERVIFIADEMPELSPAIIEAAIANLDSNPYFQLIGIGNPNSRFDAFGTFSKPDLGWTSISENSAEWETEHGKCIRFDAELSPNVLAGKVLYSYLPTEKKLAAKRKKMGANSLLFWRMYRGFWCPTGSDAGLYSEADVVIYGADENKVTWRSNVQRVAFLDTAFSQGGDRAVVQLGTIGTTIEGKTTLVMDIGYHELKSDRTKKEPLNFQIAAQFRELCVKEGVPAYNAGVDSTGGGGPFSDILAVLWNTTFHRCYFGGNPTDRPISSSDLRPCSEGFHNKVSEIWGIGVELIRTGQLKGLYPELVKEMTARLYSTRKKGNNEVIEVEPKKKMKARSSFSPDIADAAFGLVDLCRERLGLDSVEGETLDTSSDSSMSWDRYVAQGNIPYVDNDEKILDDFFANSGFIPFS